MFFRLKTKYNIDLTSEEDKEIRDYAEWLDYNIPLGVTLVKNTALDRDKGRPIAMFSMLHLHTVFITEEDVDLQTLVEKVAHELVHRKDRLKYGFFKFCFMAQLGLRERYLEPQAYAMEKSLQLRYRAKNQADIIRRGRMLKKRHLKDIKNNIK